MRYQMWDEEIFTVLIIIEKISMKHEVQWILSAEDFFLNCFQAQYFFILIKMPSFGVSGPDTSYNRIVSL